jgi:hypothetical protein
MVARHLPLTTRSELPGSQQASDLPLDGFQPTNSRRIGVRRGTIRE